MTYTTLFRRFAAAAIFLLLSACGGGGGGTDNGSSNSNSGPPYAVGGTVTGLTDPGLVLFNVNGADLSFISGNGNFAFGTELLSGAYDVVVGAQPAHQRCTVANGSGVVAAADVTDVQVTCGTMWTGTPARVTNTDWAVGAQMGMLPNGDVLTVWLQFDNSLTVTNAYSSRYTASTGTWSAPELFPHGAALSVPRIAVNANGNAMAIYSQLGAVYASRYDSGTSTWGTPVLLISGFGMTPDAHIAIDADGDAMAVYLKYVSGVYSVYARRYNAAADTWDATDTLLESSAMGTIDPRIVMDADGNAIAIWRQMFNTITQQHDIYANRYNASSGTWDAVPTLIKNNNVANGYDPQIAMDAAGNAIAIWREYGSTVFGLVANRYQRGAGTWSGPVTLTGSSPLGLQEGRIAFDPAGNAMVVWSEYYNSRSNVNASRYRVNSSTWSAPVRVDSDNTDNAFAPHVALDSDGNAMVVWRVSDNGPTVSHLYANGYSAVADAWGTPERIKANIDSQASPQIGIDADHNGVVLYDEYDALNNQYNVGTHYFRRF